MPGNSNEAREARAPNEGPVPGGMTPKDKFKELAKQAEADHDEAAFKKRLGKIAKAKPTDADEAKTK
jgi:hypothetical protein